MCKTILSGDRRKRYDIVNFWLTGTGKLLSVKDLVTMG